MPYFTNKGFTLIELLVVVLIIGILSAVALPQYQAAVMKSRLSTVMSVTKSMKAAMEVYYLANGAYPADGQESQVLDLQLPAGCTGSSVWTCKDGTSYDFYDSSQLTIAGFVGWNGSTAKPVVNGYLLWLDQSRLPGAIRCLAQQDNASAHQVCKSMGGARISETYSYGSNKMEAYALER